MAANNEAAMQELVDREAIRECLYRYCRGIDRLDEAALRSSYWPDAIASASVWRILSCLETVDSITELIIQVAKALTQILRILLDMANHRRYIAAPVNQPLI